MTQKYFKGDLVRIAADLGPSMDHFEKDCEAVVMYSYTERYGKAPNSDNQYCLFVLTDGYKGEVSWYNEDQLTFIRENAWDKLPENNVIRKIEESKLARRAA